MQSKRFELYKAIEKERNSKLLVYVTGDRSGMEAQIANDATDYFVEHLDRIGVVEKITLILHTNGGNTLAAWNIINLIRQFCDNLEIIVPVKARSAGTLMCLGADKIIMTKQATLGPIDLYFNSEKAMADEKELNTRLGIFQAEIESGKRNPGNEKLYTRYFDVKATPVRGIKAIAKQKPMDDAKLNYGYFALISNEIKDPIEALEIYRNKDLVEKAFGNLKERLNLRRLCVSSDASLDGKLFVTFIALIFLSYIKKQMQDNDLFKKYTIQGLLDEFDIIECFEQPGAQIRIGEITKRQMALYETIGISPPTSLQ